MSLHRSTLGQAILTVLLLGGSVARSADEAAAQQQSSPDTRQGIEFFERKIRPVLVEHCYSCHSSKADELGGGLLVDSRQGLRTGGESGAAVVPGDASASILLGALEYQDFEMPPEGKLPESIIEDFRRWIRLGAPDPREAETTLEKTEDDWDSRKQLWSLAAVQNPSTPQVAAAEWPRHSVDYFVLQEQEQRGLRPVADAKPLEWLRRVYFDLIGLPPSRADIEVFAQAPAWSAYTELVDRLLGSPQFGERWARHWFDVVRYAESAGSSRDVLMIYAWRYRDYVIDALNADLPYNRFITEQIAGDLLPAASLAERDRLRVATGLLAIGSKSLNGGNLQLDIIDDQIDVVSKSVLGLTVSCARCHDHKFDPIPTADYYALAGIFQSTETFYGGSTRRPKNLADRLQVYLPFAEPDQVEAVAELAKQITDLQNQERALEREIKRLERSLPKDWQAKHAELVKLQSQTDEASEAATLSSDQLDLVAQVTDLQTKSNELREVENQLTPLLQQQQEIPDLDFYLGVRDAGKIGDCAIRIRGEKNQPGDVPARGFLSHVSVASPPRISAEQSGRRELADWLTRPDNPLTARVIVNRIWQHLFGRGIVSTVDNFGVSGTAPTHPELLDHLAYRFVHAHDWSLKSLIRELVLTRTYQLSSESEADNLRIDEANQFHWRHNRRRLEAEPLRDAVLAASGEIDLRRPFASAVHEIGEGEVGRNLKTAPLDAPRRHRSVYLPVIRGLVPEVLRVFDFPDPSNPQGVRDETNVPAQSLYLLNSPFVLDQASTMAMSLIAEHEDLRERVDVAYQRSFGRSATADEVDQATAFVAQMEQQCSDPSPREREHFVWTSFCQALYSSVAFRYVD